MPIYEYECTSCHHQFDVLQKVNDAPLSQCPACSKQTATKLVSAAGFQLKGTGWYATDFKDKPKASTSSTTNNTESVKTTESTTKESPQKTNNTAE